MDYKQIDVVIHPESIIHSMVEFIDGSILAQMGLPDMLLPIQYALTYPERWGNELPRLKWKEKRVINFIPPDHDTFPCLNYAYKAGEVGGTLPAVMNAANEVAVEKFLQNEISFLHIPVLIEEIMNRHVVNYKPSLEEAGAADRWARERQDCFSKTKRKLMFSKIQYRLYYYFWFVNLYRFGHYIVAKMAGIRVLEFAIGLVKNS